MALAMDEKTLLRTVQEFFSELRIMPQDLKNPTPEFAISFYRRVLLELGVDLQSLQMIQSHQFDAFSCPEMYQDIIPPLHLSKMIQYIFAQSGLGRLNFGVSDLLAPTPKRNLSLMSHIMNFILFCDQRVADIDPKIKEFTEMKQQYQELLKKRDYMKKQLIQQATEKVHRRQVIEELHVQVEIGEKKLNEAVAEYNELKVMQKEAKNSLKVEEQGLEKATYQVKQLTSELESLKSQIVSSPEEFKDQYDKLVEQKNEKKELADNLLRQIEPKKQTCEKLCSQIEAQEIRMTMLNEILKLNEQVQDLKSEINSLKREKATTEENAEDVHDQLKTLQKKLDTVHETLLKLQTQYQQQESILSSSLDSAKMEYLDSEEKYNESLSTQQQLLEEIDSVLNYVKDLKLKLNRVIEIGKTNREFWSSVQAAQFAKMEEFITLYSNLAKKL